MAGRISADGTKCKIVAAGAAAEAGTACIGSASQDFVTYHFPIDVTINTDRVGGPSAGLAFTLAIIDDLTPGKLTDGKRVAVTGTIATDGSVGPVGGVEQKAITARRNGVQLMIVPKDEVADARERRGWDEGGRCGDRRRRSGGVGTCGRIASASNHDDCGAIMSG